MLDQTNSPHSKRGSDVPLGWLTLVIGMLLVTVWIVMDFASMIGLTNAKPPAFLYPTSLALVVCGYIACFALPRIHNRLEEIEQRLDRLTSEYTEQRKPGGQP